MCHRASREVTRFLGLLRVTSIGGARAHTVDVAFEPFVRMVGVVKWLVFCEVTLSWEDMWSMGNHHLHHENIQKIELTNLKIDDVVTDTSLSINP